MFFTLFYLIPLIIVFTSVILLPIWDKTMKRGDLLAGLGISFVPLLNILVIFFLIGAIWESKPVQNWLKQPVRKSAEPEKEKEE